MNRDCMMVVMLLASIDNALQFPSTWNIISIDLFILILIFFSGSPFTAPVGLKPFY